MSSTDVSDNDDISTPPSVDQRLLEEGETQAVELLHRCVTADGFLATTLKRNNYSRVWARDGCIMGLAALLTERSELLECARTTLLTLARYAGPHGEIPSNVDVETDRVSLGGTAGRVDANLWWVIACGQYHRRTADEAFLDAVQPALEKVRRLLGSWEFNDRGLLYIPLTGDWADEYLQHGYVLYDECLYLQAQREFLHLHGHIHGSEDHALREKATRLQHVLEDNYWFDEAPNEHLPADVYHPVLYRKAKRAVERRCGVYWMPFFCPTGYGYRFDAMANALVGLTRVAEDEQQRRVDAFVERELLHEESALLPAFHPVIQPRDEDWEDLQMSFSYEFKNQPHEYHNGGRWPLVTGFFAAEVARRGRRDQALRYLEAIHAANRLPVDGEPWSFPEYLHGETLEPGGAQHMGWSAAAAIIARAAIDGQDLFEAEAEEL